MMSAADVQHNLEHLVDHYEAAVKSGVLVRIKESMLVLLSGMAQANVDLLKCHGQVYQKTWDENLGYGVRVTPHQHFLDLDHEM